MTTLRIEGQVQPNQCDTGEAEATAQASDCLVKPCQTS